MWLILARIQDHSGADLGEIMQWICRMGCINLFRSLKRLLYYYSTKKDQFWSNVPPRVWPHSIKPLHRVPYLPQPNSPFWCLVGWSRCWPRKAWSWSTDTIQTPVGLIHIHIMHNWGPRPQITLSEAGDITKSMVIWLILTRIWMTILELIWGRLCN